MEAELSTSICRFCRSELKHTFVDLGLSPLCQNLVSPEQIDQPESFYPLHARVCHDCYLVQLDEYVSPDRIFSDYAYFSSYSDSWLAHGLKYTEKVCREYGLGPSSFVVEIASNDGYLLQHFKSRGVEVLGIEPAANVAAVARKKGIPTEVRFFGLKTAEAIRSQYRPADLIAANNVLAHVPDINDFVAGLAVLLGPQGVLTMEFPHLKELMVNNQFDTIYHEHFSYLSLATTQRLMRAHRLEIFDTERLSTHGGSLRIHVKHANDRTHRQTARVKEICDDEFDYGLQRIDTYSNFASQVSATKRDILSFLIRAKSEGHTIAGYGAPGKGNTLLNYCGIRTDFLDYTVDRSPHKQGHYTPGTRIPIVSPDRIRETRPVYLFVLPWNLKEEVIAQTSYIREWGGRWVIPIPKLEVIT